MLSRQSVLYGGNEISSPFLASRGGEGREARIKDTTLPCLPNNNNNNPDGNKTRHCVCSEQFPCVFLPPAFPCEPGGDEARRSTSKRAGSSLRVTWPEPPPRPALRVQLPGDRLFPLPPRWSQSPSPTPAPGRLQAPRGLRAIVPGAAGCSPRQKRWRPLGPSWERDPSGRQSPESSGQGIGSTCGCKRKGQPRRREVISYNSRRSSFIDWNLFLFLFKNNE